MPVAQHHVGTSRTTLGLGRTRGHGMPVDQNGTPVAVTRRLHLFGQGEDAVQLGQRGLGMGIIHIELGQVGDPFYV